MQVQGGGLARARQWHRRALSCFDSANRSTLCWWREFGHHGQPVCDVVRTELVVLDQLAQPVARGGSRALDAAGQRIQGDPHPAAQARRWIKCTVTAPARCNRRLGWPHHPPAIGASQNNSSFHRCAKRVSSQTLSATIRGVTDSSQGAGGNAQETASHPKSRADFRGCARWRATGAHPGGCVGCGVCTDADPVIGGG